MIERSFGRVPWWRRVRRLVALGGLWVPVSAWAQVPVPPTGPVVHSPHGQGGGPIHRAWAHTKWKLKDSWIGYPEYFLEPPLGSYVGEYRGMMTSRAAGHRFILHRSDFLDGTTTLSPAGASRLGRMAPRLPAWPGPILVEPVPDRPGLAEQRRDAVVALLQQSGMPMDASRFRIAASPYRAGLGDDAGSSYPVMIQRDVRAGISYPVPPIPVSLPGAGGVP